MADLRLYLGLQRVPLLNLGVKLPGVESQLHLSQESVVSEAIVVPHRDLHTSSLQLRVADDILQKNRRSHPHFLLANMFSDTKYTDDDCKKPKRKKMGQNLQKDCSHTHPQILIENRVDGIGLDARLPLALPGHIWQQVCLHITNKVNRLSRTHRSHESSSL